MRKIWLIIQREYLSRVKKKSFLLITLLGPVLMVAGISLVVWLGIEEKSTQTVLVVDEKAPVFKGLKSDAFVEFSYGNNMGIAEAKELLHQSEYTCILYIPSNIEFSNTAKLYYKEQPSIVAIRNIENQVESIVEELKLNQYKIDRKEFYDVKTNFTLSAIKHAESGKEEKLDSSKTVIGFMFGAAIYFFIFIYGVQVMRGVIEEKTSRIVEVIITSVKPFQLMLGKIIGVGMVGLTQFVLWIVLTMSIFSVVQSTVFKDFYSPEKLTEQVQATPEVMQELEKEKTSKKFDILSPDGILQRTNWPLMIGLFLFYFFGGYFLYSALFAAIGAAVDSETDTQQFMLPVTLPLTLGYVLSLIIVENPEGQVAFWSSIIPFTSPITMLVRVAIGVGEGGVPIWQVGLSMALLIIGFLVTVWFAGKIYRVGILMYGKKVTYMELWKWLTHKQ
ncbi:MAG: ABC transporter permease [Flavobacteriales bacterium]|nr:ABC transporter permease [Flavobacteriales bacterium]